MTRTLFIGLDGATFTILDEMVRTLPDLGLTMPFLQKIFAGGARARLLSTPNPLTPPAWVSFMTGRTPGNHGVYDFIRSEERSDDIYFTLYDARDVRTEMLWSIATRQGKKVVALNFPFTAPPRENCGTLIPGFVPWKHLRRSTTPPDLYERLKEMPDFDPKNLAWDFEREKQIAETMDLGDLENWIQYHIHRDEHWFRIAEKLLAEDNPDLMAVMFDGTDKLQHQIWYFIDPQLMPAEPSEHYLRLRAQAFSYFRRLDTFIERLVELAGPNTQLFMISDHGFGASRDVVRVNAFLAEKGYLVLKPNDGTDEYLRRDRSWFANLDWEKTMAYCPTPSSNGIVVRVAHQPGERGLPAAEYEAFRERLIADLLSLHDSEGKPLIDAIHKREDIYQGSALADAPDLTLRVRDCGCISVRSGPNHEMRPFPAGNHHPEGIFIAWGPGIHQGFVGERHDIVDAPATILYSLGLPIPKNFEGKVATDFFTEDYLTVHPVRSGKKAAEAGKGFEENGMGEDEKAKIMAQLQLLGYVE